MKPKQIGVLVVRIAALYLFVNSVPYFIGLWADMAFRHLAIGEYLYLYIRVGLEILSSILAWIYAPQISRAFVPDEDQGKVQVGLAEATATGLSILAVILMFNGTRGFLNMMIKGIYEYDRYPLIFLILDRNHGMPLELILGVMVLLFAPRLAVVLENRFYDIGESVHE